MSLIALPSTFRPESFIMRLQPSGRSFASPFGGSEQVIDMLNDRWAITLTLPLGTQEDAASNEAFLNSLRGQTNTVAMYHWARKQPRGTLRGAPTTISNPAVAGSLSIVLAAAPGVTLLAGDMFGVGGLLLQVASDCIANAVGNIVVPIVNRLRSTIPAGSAVAWDRPTAVFRKVSSPGFQYFNGYAGGVSIDLVEAV